MNGVRAVSSLPESMVGGVYSTAQLLASGLGRRAVEAAVAGGVLRAVRRGWYWVPPGGRVFPEQVHRARVAASAGAARAEGRDLVLAGASAAVWWGLPWVGSVPGDVVACRSTSAGRPPRSQTHRLARPPASQLTVHQDVRVTDVARTVLDVARTCHPRVALTVADAALHRGMTGLPALRRALSDLRGRTGVEAARWCLAHADGRSESPGESVSRYEMLAGVLTVPDLQVEFRLPSGAVGRVDFLWRTERLIGEFDGLVKYRPERPGPGPQDVVIAEKRREDALRSMGYRVVRWTWQDLRDPASWLVQLRALLAGS